MILIDNNISYKLKFFFEEMGVKSEHVENCNLEKSTDETVWRYAKKMNYSILSKDSDFISIYNKNGHPPKIIILTCGNKSTEQIIELLKDSWQKIAELIHNKSIGIIEVS